MSTEPIVQSRPLSDPGPDPDLILPTYYCVVRVQTDGTVDLTFYLENGEKLPDDSPVIPWGSSTTIQFNLSDEGPSAEYVFVPFHQSRRDRDSGIFLWDFAPDAPQSQRDAGFYFPPAFNGQIEEGFRTAWVTIRNRYWHEEKYKYALQVRVQHPRHKKPLTSEDPTLIEDPYEGPVDPPASRSCSCGSVRSSRNQGRLNQRG